MVQLHHVIRRRDNPDLIAKPCGIGAFMAEVDQRLRILDPFPQEVETPHAQRLLVATRLELESAQRVLDQIGPLLPVARRLNTMAGRFPRLTQAARRSLRYLWLRWRHHRRS